MRNLLVDALNPCIPTLCSILFDYRSHKFVADSKESTRNSDGFGFNLVKERKKTHSLVGADAFFNVVVLICMVFKG